MRRRVLGPQGPSVSRLALGTATWGATTDADEAKKQLTEFLEAGGNLVDTADIYVGGASEEMLGGLLRGVVPRRELVLASKAGALPGGPPFRQDLSGKHLLTALEDSLRRLGTDYLDLWQFHAWDSGTPLAESLAAMDAALRSGKVRQAGVCNFSGYQLAAAASRQRFRGAAPLVSCEVEYNLLERGIEREVAPAALEFGVGLLPWAPLGRGVLTGKYRDGVSEKRAANAYFQFYVGHHLNGQHTKSIVDTLVASAEELGVTPAAMALAWVRDRPAVVAPVVGARTAAQLRESLAAEELTLPAEIAARLDECSAPEFGYPERGIP